ncbi:MAG: hypothetical protein HZB41_14410 [Ignavibacteriae bacterium]|nr:hypothetical protein [Ignavibacteriota bacterium]
MKKSLIILSIVTLLILSSCMTSSFVYTGYHQDPLPNDNYVKIVIDGNKDLNYDEIGVIEVRESFGAIDFADIVYKACDIARVKGADCIIYMNRLTSVSGTGDAISSTNQYLFKAVKLKN